MARLILFLLLLAALALALAALATAWRALTAPGRLPTAPEDRMPNALRNVAYVVLLLLLAGLAGGWLGPA